MTEMGRRPDGTVSQMLWQITNKRTLVRVYLWIIMNPHLRNSDKKHTIYINNFFYTNRRIRMEKKKKKKKTPSPKQKQKKKMILFLKNQWIKEPNKQKPKNS